MNEFKFLVVCFVFQGLRICQSDVLECPINSFKLDGMKGCHPWLTCKDLANISIVKPLGKGSVKNVFLANWKEQLLALSIPANSEFMDDFMNGVETLRSLSPSRRVVQYLGYCDEKKALLTEYHPLGIAIDFFRYKVLQNITVIQSLEFCYQYSLILKFLHNGPNARRVFCDSNSLDKLLSQLLITSRSTLVLNDVDALALAVNSSGIKCGHRQLKGDFVAPEQLWTKQGEFKDHLMPGYNEKTDIWKAASVCNFFLKQALGADVIGYRLFHLHARCKNQDPELRPSAEELVNEYISVIKEYNEHSEL